MKVTDDRRIAPVVYGVSTIVLMPPPERYRVRVVERMIVENYGELSDYSIRDFYRWVKSGQTLFVLLTVVLISLSVVALTLTRGSDNVMTLGGTFLLCVTTTVFVSLVPWLLSLWVDKRYGRPL